MNILDLYKNALKKGEAAERQSAPKPQAVSSKPKPIVKKNTPKNMAETPKVSDVVKKKPGRPKKTVAETETKVVSITEKKTEKRAEPKNAYEKFKYQFEDYRNTQPENHRAGLKDTHDTVLEHIKELSENSEEYNAQAMHPCKDSHKLMSYCEEKQYENYKAMKEWSYKEACKNLCIWIDEYIGKQDDVEEYETAQKKREEAIKKGKSVTDVKNKYAAIVNGGKEKK